MGARGPWHAGGVHGWRGASVEHLDSCLTGVARAFFDVRSSSAEQWEQFEGQQRAANDGLPRENLDATSDLALPHPSVIWPAAGTNQGAYRAGRYIILTSFVLTWWTGLARVTRRHLGWHVCKFWGDGDHVQGQ